MGAVLTVKVWSLILALVGPGFCQVDCPPFTADLLGSTTAASTTGLVRDAFAAITGETSMITVQVHTSNIVCLRSGQTRNTYSGVSVVVNYTCNGASNPACNGNPTNSQFDFECVSGPVRWAASVDGSADNIVTTPPTGNFATTLRRDCGVCISPARFPFGSITNNEQHCGSCDPACDNGLRMCFNRVSSGCCSFYERDSCVASCTPPLVSNSSFDCVHDCPVLTITNGMVSYQPPGTPPVVGATASYTCNTGYTLSGNNMRTCQEVSNGTWTGSDPSCNPVDCGTLSRPPNGRVDVTTTTFGSAVLYDCDQGYALSGIAMRYCQANGIWSGTEPTCVSCSSQIANCTQCRVNTAPRLSLTCETCLPRYNLQGNECKLPCDVRFCKTCGDDSSKCMECNVGYEVDASKRCIVGGDDGDGGLDRPGLIGVILGAIIAFIILLAIVLCIIVGVYRLKEPKKSSSKHASRIVYPGELIALAQAMQNPLYMGSKQAEKLAQEVKEGEEEEEREEGEEEVGEKEEAREKEGSEHSLEQINAEENP